MSTTYKITGMDCQGCVKSLTRCIKGIEPLAEVTVELETGSVTTTAAADNVEAAAKMAGFTYEGTLT